ncbi:MAG TPA: hypothetical protein VLJ39_08585 [Tepidisphaeraceae bacterium]|jgi:hypothetical protein|nr:hypothetical protein [Tepidisphaeraceae bacterium]
MIRASWLSVVVIAGSLLVGCDTRETSPAKTTPPPPTTAPATQPVALAPTTRPASTEPATSQLTIDGQLYKFPVAKLRVTKSDGQVIARLYSDDPKSALEDDYKGNHYDMLMKLDDIQDPHMVYMANWQFKAHSHEQVDTPYGIFLYGMKYQLQPLDATARFLGDMLMVQVALDGQFLMFDDSDKTAGPKVVHVNGAVLATVEYKD